jgi:nicotinate-nucleotide adenylyltransferase
MQKKKIGLYGGTFDPVHNMHIAIAEKTLEQLFLDQIWFLADKNPRLKDNATDYAHRLKMLSLATSHNEKLISDILPIQKTGATHDINSLRKFIREFPKFDFVIIGGMDSILRIETWDNYDEFIRHAEFAVVKRPGSKPQHFDNLAKRLEEQSFDLNYSFIDINENHLSSSTIRNNRDVENFVSPKVAEYIRLNQLY